MAYELKCEQRFGEGDVRAFPGDGIVLKYVLGGLGGVWTVVLGRFGGDGIVLMDVLGALGGLGGVF